jgi:cobalt-zinc-cadmium efflux system outer membrane protein
VTRKSIFLMGIVLVIFLFFVVGCAVNIKQERETISSSIEARVGKSLPPISKDQPFQLPVDVTLEDGLSEEEAIAIALWNNAQFQADLVRLKLAKADLAEARMIKNPVLSLLFPVGPKQLEAALNLPIEILWQRPNRIAFAKLNTDQVTENLIQNGLSLVQDVLTAYADLVLAEQRAEIMKEEAGIQAEIASIAGSRLRVGDISELEATAIRLEALRTEENSINFINQAMIQNLRLKTLLGMVAVTDKEISLQPGYVEYEETILVNELVNLAYTARSDLKAAEIAIEAAGKRLGWERSKIVNLTAVLDANAEGKEGFEMGPGMQVELPILSWNKGGRARAAAQMEQAAKQYLATRNQISCEIREAYQNYLSAHQILTLLRNKSVPQAQQASQNAEKAYLVGEISYLEYLEFKRQLLSSRLREAEAIANMRRAEAQLRYSVGFQPMKLDEE